MCVCVCVCVCGDRFAAAAAKKRTTQHHASNVSETAHLQIDECPVDREALGRNSWTLVFPLHPMNTTHSFTVQAAYNGRLLPTFTNFRWRGDDRRGISTGNWVSNWLGQDEELCGKPWSILPLSTLCRSAKRLHIQKSTPVRMQVGHISFA